MSREDFTRYVEERGFEVRERSAEDHDFVAASLVKVDGRVYAASGIGETVFDQGPAVWDLLMRLTDEELDRQRAKLGTSDPPG